MVARTPTATDPQSPPQSQPCLAMSLKVAAAAAGAAIEGGHELVDFVASTGGAVQVFAGAAHAHQFFEDVLAVPALKL